MKLHPITAAMAAVSLLSVNTPLYAQQDQAKQDPTQSQAAKGHKEHQDSIEEIIVSASPLAKSHSENVRPAAVLSGDRLRQQAAATLGQTLQGQLGVASASFGPGVGTPVIRGQQGNRVKVMQDNLDSLDAANASSDHANAVEALLAERIEVLRGPQTLRYGSGAIGGVINVIDNRIPSQLPEATRGTIETRYSTVNQESATVAKLEGGAGSIAWHIDGLYRESDDVDIPGFANHEGALDPEDSIYGRIDNSDSQSQNWTAGLSWVGEDDSFFGLSVSRLENEYGIPPGAHEHADHDDDHDEDHDDHEDEHDDHDEDHEDEHHDDEHENEEEAEIVRIDMEQTRYDLKGQFNAPMSGIERLTLRMAYVDYQHHELEGGAIGTTYSSEAYEGRLEAVHSPWMGGQAQGAFGLQFSDKDFQAQGAEAFIPGSVSQSLGVFVVEEWNVGSWLFEAGARLENNEIEAQGHKTQDFNTHSLSFASQYRFAEQQQLNLVLSRAQRAPSVEELFSDGIHVATQSYELGNAELDEETSHNIELGYKMHLPLGQDYLELDAGIFYNDIEDFIYRANTGSLREDQTLIEYAQQGAEFMGVELQVSFPISRQGASSWDMQVFYDSVRAELDSGEDVPRITPQRFGLQLDHHGEIYGKPFDAQLRVSHVARQDKPGLNEEETDSYVRVDGNLNYRVDNVNGEWVFFLRADNLLDEEIRNASSFLREVAPEPGRGFTLGARYSF